MQAAKRLECCCAIIEPHDDRRSAKTILKLELAIHADSSSYRYLSEAPQPVVCIRYLMKRAGKKRHLAFDPERAFRHPIVSMNSTSKTPHVHGKPMISSIRSGVLHHMLLPFFGLHLLVFVISTCPPRYMFDQIASACHSQAKRRKGRDFCATNTRWINDLETIPDLVIALCRGPQVLRVIQAIRPVVFEFDRPVGEICKGRPFGMTVNVNLAADFRLSHRITAGASAAAKFPRPWVELYRGFWATSARGTPTSSWRLSCIY